MYKKFLISTSIVTILFAMGCSNSTSDELSTPVNNESDEQIESESSSIEMPTTDLQKKDQGTAVKSLQEALNHIGYEIKIDGIYNEETTWAITDFQLQEDLFALGIYNEETKSKLEEYVSNEQVIEVGKGLSIADEPVSTSNGTRVLANPYDQLAIINKENALPADYEPEDLVIPDVPFPFEEDLPKKKMRQVAATALEELFQAANEAGLQLYAQSGYRSYDTQVSLFESYVRRDGEDAANKYSARPGESEHQSGLTMDVTSPDIGYQINIDFENTEEGKWLEKNAANFGFIIRYPKGKEEITQYQYEPWHIRYVGEKAAKEIMDSGITLEEYMLND